MNDVNINSEKQSSPNQLGKSTPTADPQDLPLGVIGPKFAPGVRPQLPNLKPITRSSGIAPEGCQWWEYTKPFRHFGATNVFNEATYKELCHQFSLILDVTNGEREGKYKLTNVKKNYDALILGLNDTLATEFAPIFTEEWLKSIAQFMNIEFLPRIEGALHSSPPNSKTGWIHTDLCSAWFDEKGTDKEKLMLPPRGRCNYFTGRTSKPDAEPAEYVRAATMIFYLCNDDWESGDGGETGLYGAHRETKYTDKKLITPINNSLLLFECSPHSYHRFITNPKKTRNSIILWLHSNVENAEARWGNGINRRQQ